jgi:hypothetical protein
MIDTAMREDIRVACEGLTGTRVNRVDVSPVQSLLDCYLVLATFPDDSSHVYLLPGYVGQGAGWIQTALSRMEHMRWELGAEPMMAAPGIAL